MNNRYSVSYTKAARKTLQKLDPFVRKNILSWIGKNLVGCKNPRQFGKGLVGDRAGQWRYRVGEYRIIAEIQDDRVLILVLAIGHRRSIYEER